MKERNSPLLAAKRVHTGCMGEGGNSHSRLLRTTKGYGHMLLILSTTISSSCESLLSVIEIGENHWKYSVPTHINRNLELERFPLQKSSNFSPHILLFRVVAQVHNIRCFFSLSGEPT
jgi:hypothetical protein